ncbi:glucose 1-dehydrogenase [Purpureocillium lavendulum]|uniref:Glucose 1-dehydrogenase n=1 Tax=Purpureocillium lavendulum TaxID=1247861 RepID=A0AB34G4J0_9HYPO|nr:glucose 1-dehydrogenase [Purpureocillium lavendulum]
MAQSVGGKYAVMDVTSWESQVTAFQQAIDCYGRIDYVFPFAGIGENKWVASKEDDSCGSVFLKPNLSVLDINLTGALYTMSLAVQHFRRQKLDLYGFRGKIVVSGSFCGIYCCPSLPIYTTSKHAITGIVRCWGKQLVTEGITLNSVNPNVMRTNLSTNDFYDNLDREGLLTPIDGVTEACIQFLGENGDSGQCCEVGPNYHHGQGMYLPLFPLIMDKKQQRVYDKLEERGQAR